MTNTLKEQAEQAQNEYNKNMHTKDLREKNMKPIYTNLNDQKVLNGGFVSIQ